MPCSWSRDFLLAGITKTVLATSLKGRINGTNSEKMHLQTIVEQYPEESSTAQSGTDSPGV